MKNCIIYSTHIAEFHISTGLFFKVIMGLKKDYDYDNVLNDYGYVRMSRLVKLKTFQKTPQSTIG